MALRPKAKARPNEGWALRPKARPAVSHDPQHVAMAAGSGGDDGDGGRRDDEDSMRRRGTNGPAPDPADDDDEDLNTWSTCEDSLTG